VGGRLKIWGGSNARLGKGDIFVAEADESDGSFMALSPALAVVTNIDLEHLDHYRDMNEISSVFAQYINRMPFYGKAILCIENEEVRNMIPNLSRKYITYGTSRRAEIQAGNIEEGPFSVKFDVARNDLSLGTVTLALPGRQNVLNALAAIAVGLECDIDMDKIRQGLKELCGPDRRFQVKGEKADIIVVDDYGHHPTEIEATLETAKTSWPDRRLAVVFQPHRYSRTRDLYDRFVKCFDQADLLIVTPIYSAGESMIEGVDSEWLYQGIKDHGHKDVILCKDLAEIQSLLAEKVRPGDTVITMGAGNIYKAGNDLLERLERVNG
jgi:UDP-N-acetylmuramate--alanine ligase